MTAFRRMADDAKELVTMQVGHIGERNIVPMVHLTDAEGYSTGYGDRWPDVESLAIGAQRIIRVWRPEVVALTFHGQRGRLDGFFEHEVATVVVIDRERIEVWEARLVRHDGTASLGAWRPWPIDAAAGKLTTPIQDAMRGAR